MESVEESQFPNSTQFLHASERAMYQFIELVKNHHPDANKPQLRFSGQFIELKGIKLI